MKGLLALNKEVEKILFDPARYHIMIFRVWRTRFRARKLSLEKKIDIIEKYGDQEIFFKLHLKKDKK